VSIENMFRFIKSIYLRKLKAVFKDYGLNIICREYLNNAKESHIASFPDIMKFVRQYDDENNTRIENDIKDETIGLILNQFRWQVDKEFGQEITKMCNKYLYFNYHFLGTISLDIKIADATMNNRVFVKEYSYAKAATEIYNIARAITEESSEQALALPLVS
jgi:flagellar biosynthesis protein FlhG